MINAVTLVGRLTKDPELRYLPSGVPMCKFIIAINRPFSNQQGEKDADFITCIAWRKQAENLVNFMKKGNLIGLIGKIQTGSFEGQDGKKVYTTDVVADSIQFLESSKNSGQQNQYPQNNQGQYGQSNQQQQQPQYQNSYGQGSGQHSPQSNYPPQQSFSTSAQGDYPNNPSTYPRMDENPFLNSKHPSEVSDDDLPF